ncbi:MAG: anthranilate synthase component I family protein [Planctomycetes bacterium]|nr:anthranilate synthase component I family protein [Planctomycetota bacterium]
MTVPPSETLEHCLSWLATRDEGALPSLLLSAGPVTDDARYCILAERPRFVVEGTPFGAMGGRFSVRDTTKGSTIAAEPIDRLFDVLRQIERDAGKRHSSVPGQSGSAESLPFSGGWIGALGYDLAWSFEYGIPRYRERTTTLPDIWLGFYEEPMVVDRTTGAVFGDASAITAFSARDEQRVRPRFRAGSLRSAFHREDYEAAVERVRRHCIAGDLFQADLTRRIEFDLEGDPRGLFESLVERSPASHMAYLGLGDGRAVVSASPEEYLRIVDGTVRSRPIKGTRPRADSPERDRELRDDLLASDKDIAELTMIVDLVRNDLGRIAEPGSVEVGAFPSVLELPQVWHLMADVRARVDARHDVWDVIAASFPAGSIVGAPKPMALEILERVERSRRGFYTGAIGYLEPGGNATLSVAIRTAEVSEGRLRIGVGGGITALSVPSEEFEETCDKARGFLLALGAREDGVTVVGELDDSVD